MKNQIVGSTQSAPFSLNKFDWEKIARDMAFFAIVPLTFYIAQVLSTIQQPGYVLSLEAFIPTNATMIAIIAWILNQALNVLKKFVQ